MYVYFQISTIPKTYPAAILTLYAGPFSSYHWRASVKAGSQSPPYLGLVPGGMRRLDSGVELESPAGIVVMQRGAGQGHLSLLQEGGSVQHRGRGGYGGEQGVAVGTEVGGRRRLMTTTGGDPLSHLCPVVRAPLHNHLWQVHTVSHCYILARILQMYLLEGYHSTPNRGHPEPHCLQ